VTTKAAKAEEPRWHALAVLALGALVAWALPFFMHLPTDYNEFVLPWYRHIVAYGPIEAFAHPFSNYTPPYLYLLSATTLIGGPPVLVIKGLSVVSGAWAAYAAYRLMSELGLKWALEAALAMLLLPTMVINVPFYGQADMFWIAPCLFAITAACRSRNLAMVLWASLAFAIKAQAVFLAPFVMAMLINRRSPWSYWMVPPVIYALAMLPAWLAGWPAYDLLTVYVRQAQYVPANGIPFVSTASNPWALFWYLDLWLAVRSYWIGFAAAAVATAIYVAFIARRHLSGHQIVLAAALSATMLPFLLPGMHERFFALAELVTFCWAAGVRTRSAVAAAALMQLQFMLSYFGWALTMFELTIAGAFFTASALWTMISVARTKSVHVADQNSDQAPNWFRSGLPFDFVQQAAKLGRR
jgi:Gpi18-like mannosyltransferase